MCYVCAIYSKVSMARPYLLKKRGKYWHYRLAGERTFHTTGKTNKEAAHVAAGKAFRNQHPDEKILLKEFAVDFFSQDGPWVAARKARDRPFSPPMTRLRNTNLENHILPIFGSRSISRIQAHEVDDWILSLPLANSTKNAILDTFRLVLKEAQRRKIIDRNPIEDIERMADRYLPTDAFTLEDLKKLFPRDRSELLRIWGHAKWATIHYLMLTAGLRVGEAAALLWRHIVWDIGGLLVLQAVKADVTIGPTKSGTERSVILPERSLAMLKCWQEETPYPDPEHYIFFSTSGDRYFRSSSISRKMRPVLRDVEIDQTGRRLRTHSLRHTYNTRLEKVLPAEVLRYMIGHSSDAMTKRYLHKTPEDRLQELLTERDKIDQAWD